MNKRRSITAPRVLTVLVVLQALTLAHQWLIPVGPSVAMAQVPDGGSQRLQMIEEQRATNAKLDRIVALLESGKLQVQAVNANDEKKNAR